MLPKVNYIRAETNYMPPLSANGLPFLIYMLSKGNYIVPEVIYLPPFTGDGPLLAADSVTMRIYSRKMACDITAMSVDGVTTGFDGDSLEFRVMSYEL